MPTQKVRYVGPQAEVEIAATGDLVKQGHQVEVDSELAKSLLEQQDVWEKADRKKGS